MKYPKMKFIQLYILLILIIGQGCKNNITPKPRGFFRIDFPEKNYTRINKNIPYNFEIPVYSELIPDSGRNTEPYWYNMSIPKYNAELHLSYKQINIPVTGGQRGKNMEDEEFVLSKYTEESRSLVYGHTIKADAINELLFINPESNVYGTIYFIEGNAASPIQFYLTDSTTHFLRGALYINEVPKIDSIKPVIDFLKPDIINLIETTIWN